MFERLRFARYIFTLVAEERAILPAYKGSLLRGGFGVMLRRICCANKGTDCYECMLRNSCAYSYVFESSPPMDTRKLRKYRDIPRPFVIEPPEDIKMEYLPGDELSFSIVLIGEGLRFLPYSVFAIGELAKTGLGENRSKFRMENVELKVKGIKHTIYSISDGVFRSIDAVVEYKEVESEAKKLDKGHIRVLFRTPTRIRFNNDLAYGVEFHQLMRSLLHRLSSLAYFHCNEELGLDFEGFITQAREVANRHKDLQWLDISRYSSRKKQELKIGGFVGRIDYEGDLSVFLPLLTLGKYLHIGTATTFGLGRYDLEQ
jgi:hypothetical protein